MRCIPALFCFNSPTPGAVKTQNSRAAPASLSCSLQIKSLGKDFVHSDKLCDVLTQPGLCLEQKQLIRENQGSFLEEKQGLKSLRDCPAWADQPPKNWLFSAGISYKQSCSSLRANNAIAAREKLKE